MLATKSISLTFRSRLRMLSSLVVYVEASSGDGSYRKARGKSGAAGWGIANFQCCAAWPQVGLWNNQIFGSRILAVRGSPSLPKDIASKGTLPSNSFAYSTGKGKTEKALGR